MNHNADDADRDLFLDEVRWLKQRAAERANYDLRTMYEQVKQMEEQVMDRLVSRKSDLNHPSKSA